MTKSSKVPFSVTSANATAASRYCGGTASGAPVSGTWVAGDYVIAQNGHLWIYNGTAWVDSSAGFAAATTVTSGTAFGVAAAVGTATTYAREDHQHGTHAALTAADIAPGTFAATSQYIFPSGTWVAVQGQALDLSSANGTSSALGSGVGDKISLYGQSFGFGVQTNRLVAYVASGASFAVRQNSGTGNASSGTDVFTVSSAGDVAVNDGGAVTGTATLRSIPRGIISKVQITANQTTITALVDVTGSSQTVTLVAGRRYRFCASGTGFFSSVDNDVYQLSLSLGGVIYKIIRGISTGTSSTAQANSSFALDATVLCKASPTAPQEIAAGSTVCKLTVVRGGTGTMTMSAGTTNPTEFYIEDLGGF